MEKYFILAEKLADKFTPEIMCQILGGMTDEQIDEMIQNYE